MWTYACGLSLAVLLPLGFLAVEPTQPEAGADVARVARGRYIVESVGVCWRCHTPPGPVGAPQRSRWLMGSPVPIEPTVPVAAWAQVAPRLAGSPPGTDEEFVTLMMTGVSRTGRPPDPPMPRFSMTREDAGAVLAYLKSLRPPDP